MRRDEDMDPETVIFDRVEDEPPAAPTRPADRDLTAALAAAAPRRWWNRGTVVLAAMLLVLGGFVGGAQAQKRWGETPTAARTSRSGGLPGGLPSAFPGGGSGRSGSGTEASPAAAGSATTGKVKLVDGGVLYLETADGGVVTVRTNGNTAVRTSQATELAELKAGQTVSVQGARTADGTVTATAVTATG
ncbi:DUF5666 domain-containing protein [Micromonospora sp. WMMD964]|uniref:DUF5666 domain-containing protein n=1 Tax=Micromonospora sp. WMMD964 TaxID=3016091 RepID=UPI002499F9BB|nr:DUF5666 domain-containing protein [Micromonospora sp. WMMD964]WFF02705.1 DUF5666 domain-containing protein [Micromonospora sp. WMMD964]